MASLFNKVFGKPQKKSTSFIQGAPVAFRWGRSGIHQGEVDLPQSYEDYTDKLYKKNGIVFAAAQTIANPFSEIRFRFQEIDEEGRNGEFFGGDELGMVERPWPGGSTAEMNALAVQDYVIAGNFYVIKEKVKIRGKKVDRLRRLRPDWVQVILSAPASENVKSDPVGILYWPGGVSISASPTFYTVDEYAHWMPKPDPEMPWIGMSPLTPVLDEILSDNSAVEHKQKYFDNAATPSMTIALKETVTPEQFSTVMEQVQDSTGINSAYDPLVVGGGADVRIVGSDLKQIDFRNVTGQSETRIAAALGTHPVLVPMSEGMQGSSLNSGNAKVAKDIFIDMTLRPLLASYCAALSRIVEVPGSKEEGQIRNRLWYDERDVAFFREDRLELTQVWELEAKIITSLTREGFNEESVVEALMAGGDWSMLTHSGLFSVQLWPPGSDIDDADPSGTSAGPADETTPAGSEQATGGNAGLGQRSVNPNEGTSGQPTNLARKPPSQKPRSSR